MKTVTFGGVDLSQYGFVAESKIDSAPPRSYEEVEIQGKNGTLHLDNGRYENCEQVYNGVVYGNYHANIRAMRSALYSKVGYHRLEDNINNDEFYMAILKDEFEPSQTNDRTMGTFEITFERKPQRFLKSGETAVVFTDDGTIANPTEYDARPLIKVTGKGTFGVGEYSMTITGVAGQVIYIDCESMEAWEIVGGAKQSRNDYVQYAGNTFPVLTSGNNSIALGSGIDSVEITPRWWRL